MLRAGMATWKRLIERAKTVAEQVVDRIAKPEPSAPTPTPTSTPAPEPPEGLSRVDPDEVLRRVKAKAEHGLKPEDTVVVVYATMREKDETDAIVRCFDDIETTVRVMDLDKEPLQTRRQLATLTGVMVPPYVYINGRYWGAQYEIVALLATGDLPAVVAHRLDEIGPEARRIGKLHDTYSDDMTVENILARLRLGHILCVDDLDAWFEDEKGVERFFYQGGERPVAEMPAIAADIARRIEAGESEAQWRLDTLVRVN
jgi:hypothetical protein